MLAEPLFTGFLYMYLYNYFITYGTGFNVYNKRDNTKNFMIGAGINLLVKWFSNPLLSLFGMKHY